MRCTNNLLVRRIYIGLLLQVLWADGTNRPYIVSLTIGHNHRSTEFVEPWDSRLEARAPNILFMAHPATSGISWAIDARFYLNRCRFLLVIVKCLGGLLFVDTVYK